MTLGRAAAIATIVGTIIAVASFGFQICRDPSVVTKKSSTDQDLVGQVDHDSTANQGDVTPKEGPDTQSGSTTTEPRMAARKAVMLMHLNSNRSIVRSGFTFSLSRKKINEANQYLNLSIFEGGQKVFSGGIKAGYGKTLSAGKRIITFSVVSLNLATNSADLNVEIGG